MTAAQEHENTNDSCGTATPGRQHGTRRTAKAAAASVLEDITAVQRQGHSSKNDSSRTLTTKEKLQRNRNHTCDRIIPPLCDHRAPTMPSAQTSRPRQGKIQQSFQKFWQFCSSPRLRTYGELTKEATNCHSVYVQTIKHEACTESPRNKSVEETSSQSGEHDLHAEQNVEEVIA